MNIKTLIVFGSTSSIAKVLLPDLNFEPNQIFSFDRVKSKQDLNEYIPKANQHHLDWNDLNKIEKSIGKSMNANFAEPILVLNFMGVYGSIQKIDELDIEDALLTNSMNLLPFFLIAKIAKTLPTGTRIISFSGAGVGGDNLDDSSLGYLAAKASMAILTEAIDQQLAKHGVRFGLISPGAFPSRMQEVVSQESTKKIPELRVSRAKEVMMSVPSTERLAKLVIFLADNAHLLGGRTWSANFDELVNQDGNFGKLRRIY
jgi:NAD(P)-dependent dehydrogenase (short-subunit alcohol dehydrogenase family)